MGVGRGGCGLEDAELGCEGVGGDGGDEEAC